MKKTIRITLVAILLIIASISVYYFFRGKAYVKGATSNDNEPFSINVTEEQLISEYSNIYNVDYGQMLMTQETSSTFQTTALAQVRGESVTFTNYKTKNVTTGKTCLENNIMAAIINGAGVKNVGYKYSEEEGEYFSGAQLAIWEFWNTWIENSGAKENGFEKGVGNITLTQNELNGEIERKKAQEFAIQNMYNVNIYFLQYFAENNEQDGINIDNQPNLILIETLDEDGEIIEPEREIEENSDIYILVTNNSESIVKSGEEILYNIHICNESEEEQQNLVLSDKLPKRITFIDVVEIVDNNEVELKENVDYNYNQETRKLTVNINKIDGATTGTMINDETGESIKYTKNGSRKYKITVKANELEEGIYSKEIENVAEVQKENRIYAREKTGNIISDAYLEVEIEELPKAINEKEQCIIGLRITNKGLINADNVNVKVSIPQEILMKKYKISTYSDAGGENVVEGTTSNEFEKNFTEILAQRTIYIQLIGTINEIEETKQITIKGNVNEEIITWTTNAEKVSYDIAKVTLDKRRLLK